MKEDIKNIWVEALRSGEYNQGYRRLRNGDNFCCLGVLCDLHSKMAEENSHWKFGQYLNCEAALPRAVMDWAGMATAAGDYLSWETCLAMKNDRGASFLDISEIIEEYWKSI